MDEEKLNETTRRNTNNEISSEDCWSDWLSNVFLLHADWGKAEEAEETNDPVIDVNWRRVTFCFHAPGRVNSRQHHWLHQRRDGSKISRLPEHFTQKCTCMLWNFLYAIIDLCLRKKIQMWFLLLLPIFIIYLPTTWSERKRTGKKPSLSHIQHNFWLLWSDIW